MPGLIATVAGAGATPASFWPLLAAVAPVFIMLAIGWIMRRRGAIQPEADASILRMGVNVFYPALIADTILGNAALRSWGNVVLPAAMGAATVLLGFAVALGSAAICGLRERRRAHTFAFTAGLQNYGFIAIPLVDVIFGRRALGVQFTFVLGVEIVLWSVGVWLLATGKPRAGDGVTETNPSPPLWRAVLTAPVLAILISLGVNSLFGAEWLPPFGRTALKWLGSCSFPIQIILTGAVLADVIRRAANTHWVGPVLLGCVVRQAVMPLLILLLLSRVGASVELHQIMVVQAAMPSAMVPVILTRHYDGDTDLAAWLVTLSTALGLLSIPLWMRAGLWWIG